MMKKFILSAFVLSLLASCHHIEEQYSAITQIPMPFKGGNKFVINKDKQVSATSYGMSLLYIPLGNPTVEKALEKVVEEQGPGCVGVAEAIVTHRVDILFNEIHVSGYPIMKKSR